MAYRTGNKKRIYIEQDYDNIIVVNPNEIYDSNGIRSPRLVDHEDLVFYANLETFIIPRTKLAIGENFDSLDSVVINTTIATIFDGDEDLKINFLKPKGKTAFDTSWSDQLTGSESRLGKGSNQRYENTVNVNGSPKFVNSIKKYEDTQLLGIKSIRVDIKGTGVPDVSIEMVDIQGKALFEQGEGSIYSAFFNLPYPLFYLTLKGYYGKAIRYRLSLVSFNSKFDSSTGNYDISLKLIGKFTALLFDTPLSYSITAPSMYNSQITVTDPKTNTVSNISTYKGRQVLDEVYNIYKKKGLIDNLFPHLTIPEFIKRSEDYIIKLQSDVESTGDFTKFNDVNDFRLNLNNLRKYVYDNSVNNYLDRSSYYVSDGLIYYPYKKEFDAQFQYDYKTKINDRIIYYSNLLKKNTTFGDASTSKYNIPIKFSDEKDVIKKLDITKWLSQEKNVIDTYYYRTGRQLNMTVQSDVDDFNKFKLDEEKLKLATGKVLKADNTIIDYSPDYFVFGNKRIDDGIYLENSFLDNLDDANKTLDVWEEEITKDLTKILAERALKHPLDGGLGFNPTIRNIFAIILSGADTFYRLMDDVHKSAWEVRDDTSRLLSIIPPSKSFSVDNVNSIQSSTGKLNKDNIVYPWPLYFIQEKQKDGRLLYTIQYPGDSTVINTTKAYDYRIWPEIGFVEAYLKGSTETSKPSQTNVYTNPTTLSEYVSSNAIEFPLKNTPYDDLNNIYFFYEIFERSYLISNYIKIKNTTAKENNIDQFFANNEGKNIEMAVANDIQLNQTLKNYKFVYSTFLDYLKKISNDGNGDSWQNLIRSLFKTKYIVDELKTQNGLYSIDTLNGETYKTISSDNPNISDLTNFLKDTKSSGINFLDTYPLSNIEWIKKNVSNGDNVDDYESFNDTTKTFNYLNVKKIIGRVSKNETYDNISLLTSNKPLTNQYQINLDVPVFYYNLLNDYYTNRENKDLYITESYIDYGNEYSGNVNSSIQTTSLLNSPYFINALLEGVDKNKTKTDNAFVSLGYLFLNSLPLITTKEKLKSLNADGTINDLDYLASTFKKYSSIHQVPYAWVLKYGSIWHRYKHFVNTNVDILSSVWKDFDYKSGYDPIGNSIDKKYKLPTYDGDDNIEIELEKNIYYTDALSGYSKSILNVGFYPKVINAVNNYFFDVDLLSGYDDSDFTKIYEEDGFKIGINANSTTNLPFGFSPLDPKISLLKNNYYQYKETKTLTNNNKLLLFPSMGGIPVDQSRYECLDSNNDITKNITGNTATYNGSVRCLWASPHFGYFDNKLIKKPHPTQYLKVIKKDSDDQSPFNFSDNISNYESIDEIFSIFTTELLDIFEEKFISFCNHRPKTKDLILSSETNNTTQNNSSVVPNLKEKRLFNQLKNLFFINKTAVNLVDETSDGVTLGKRQIENFTKSIESFLNFDCIIKIGNPGNFDRRLFNSFSNLTDFVPVEKLVFSPYVKGTLPGDGTKTTLIDSLVKHNSAWKTLRLYVGFSTVPKIDYPNQVQVEFPSLSPPTPTATPIPTQIQPTSTTPINPVPTPTPTQIIGPITASTHYTFQSCCDNNFIFNVIINDDSDSDVVTNTSTYIENKVYHLEVIKSLSSPKIDFCAVKIKNTDTFNEPSDFETFGSEIESYYLLYDDGKYENYEFSPAKRCVNEVFAYDKNNPCLTLYSSQQLTVPKNINPTILTPNIITPIIGTQTSLISDFFIDNNIEFTSENIIKTRQLIRLYAQKKLENPNINKNEFTKLINNFLIDQRDLQTNVLNLIFKYLNTNLKDIVVKNNSGSAVSGDAGKLTLYNTFKAFNDKWIAGSDLKNVTLFEDFLFMDRANSDLGDTFVVDIKKILERIDIKTNPTINLMTVISNILKDNNFMFFAMPAYVNFYGIQKSKKGAVPIEDKYVGNSLFGTYLEVDYTKSSPKFLCLYMGNPSEIPKPKENSFTRFNDDSFDLRIPDNPLRVSDPNRDYSKTNKVVGFSVDFGIQNQNIFKGFNMDMSEIKNTSESFKILSDLGSSVSGDQVAQQSVSMYSIYKSRSYNCSINSMGNAMIQPTMYFILRHVPLFYGPYWIFEVSHTIDESGFKTDFKGVRIPKYSLPNINQLTINVNQQILEYWKSDLVKTKEKTKQELEEELKNNEDPNSVKIVSSDVCLNNSEYPSIPFVPIVRTPYTITEVASNLINFSPAISRELKSLLYIIALTRPINRYDDDVLNSMNNNIYEISTESKHLATYDDIIKEQVCVGHVGDPFPLVSFQNLKDATDFMVRFYGEYNEIINDLVDLNPDVDNNKSYGKALTQLTFTTWDTSLGIGKNASEIKEITLNNINTNFTQYDTYVDYFTLAYKNF